MFGRNFTPQKELLEKIAVPVLALSGDVDMLPGVDTSFFRRAASAPDFAPQPMGKMEGVNQIWVPLP